MANKTALTLATEQLRLAERQQNTTVVGYWRAVIARLHGGVHFDVACRFEALQRGIGDPLRFRLQP